jgi:hypothetical protein
MKCNAIFRLPAPSKGEDEDVRVATERGLKIYYSREDIPSIE